ncbi:MAG: FAD-dependent oxidoreductase [Eubacteriaceae bacterium]|nr:FAD-dependent oxidoreductase [Eubacteriaceae bacterium]
MKLVVVGGVAGGASAAARVRRLDADAEIVIFERGEHVSFSNCSLPYYLGGVVESDEDLIMMFPEDFKNNHDIDVYTRHEVTAINRERKTVTVRNLNTGEEYEEAYDKLVLSPGAKPVVPKSIDGVESSKVFTIRNVTDISRLKNTLDAAGMEKVTVVGGGFIGIETAENLKLSGKTVTVIEGTNQIMAPYDYDMVQTLHKELDDNGIRLYLETTVTSIEDGRVTAVRRGEQFFVEADAVVLAIGVAPETSLAENAGLEIGETGGIKVNPSFQTSDSNIYAVGDAIETFNGLTHKPGRIALAGPAQRQARAAADHICGKQSKVNGFIGSSCIKVFGLNAACTGLNEKTAEAQGLSYDSVLLFPSDKVGLMPDSNYMQFKLVFEVPTGRILGAQAIGTGEADKRIDVIAAMITMGADLEDLKELELCYAPPFSTAKDVVNMAALVALNILYGRYRQVHVDKVRQLAEEGACIIDVRSPEEFESGHVKGAGNIPLGQLRQRLEEIPKDVPVYLHCRSSQRSYYATCCLQGKGFDNIINISGSFLGISLYEYFNDKTEGREPIVTEYNFD